MCRLFVLFLIIFNCFSSHSYCQQPEVGKPMPDFKLGRVLNYKNSEASLQNFSGKWLVLDFWESGCVPCIKKFPEINDFQAHFKDQIQFVLVGAADKTIKEGNWNNMPALIGLYERISKKQNLNLVNAYDSVLWNKWDIGSYPTIYIVDPKGVLRYITEGRNMSIQKLQLMLDGENPDFSAKMNERQSFDVDSVLESVGADSSVLYFSILTKFKKQRYSSGPIDQQLIIAKADSNYIPGGYSISGTPLAYLYNLAYMGYPSVSHADFYKPEYVDIYYPMPVLELNDKTPFQVDTKNEKGLFNYGLKVPMSQLKAERLMAIMQNDLKSYFGYTATVEEREMPVWKLIAKPEAEKLLKSKSKKTYARDEGTSGGAAGIVWRNMKGNLLKGIIDRYMSDRYDIPYVDATGIDYNIDITIDADMSKREQVRSELQKYGLDLVQGTRKYKVIVIKD